MVLDLSVVRWHVATIVYLLGYWKSISHNVEANEKNFSFLDVKKTWMEQGHNLSRYYADEHVEIYYDIPKFFPRHPPYDSSIFKRVKELYNSTFFEKDLKIYVVNHKECVGHRAEIHNEMNIGLLNVIHCQEEHSSQYSSCHWNSIFREEYYRKYYADKSDNVFLNMIEMALNYFISAEEIPKHFKSDWKIVDLLRYYTLKELGVEKYDFQYMTGKWGKFPQRGINLFKRWHRIIYDKYGGGKTVRNFLAIIKNLSETDVTFRNRTILPGEFVHLWSASAGVDLRYFAYMSFGWTSEYQEQFQIARTKFLPNNYADTFTNYTRLPPLRRCIQEYKKDYSNSANLCPQWIQMENNVAFVIPPEHRKRTSFLLKPFAQAWSYVSETYGPLGRDPYLYFKISYRYSVLNVCKLNRDLNSYLPKMEYGYELTDHFLTGGRDSTDHFNEIVCALHSNNYQSTEQVLKHIEDFPCMLRLIATNTLATSRETGNWPAERISGDSAVDVVTYDILIALGRTQDANQWANRHFEPTSENEIDDERKLIFHPRYPQWIRYWYLPLYTHFHGTRALTAFIDQLSAHWPKQGTDYKHQLDVGHFVHFWSAALNKDLRGLADKTFGWSEKFQQEYEEARSEFTNFNYTDDYVNGSTFSPPFTWKENWFGHREQLTLVQAEKDVAFYWETNTKAKDFPSWLLELMTDAGFHVKEIYGPFSDDPNLHVILHEGKHEGCVTSTLQNTFNHKSVLACGLDSSLSWNEESPVTKDLFVQGLASLVLENVKWTGPSLSPLRSNDWRWHLSSILVYDIYSSLNKTLDLSRWTKKRNEKSDVGDPKLLFGKNDPMFRHQADKTNYSMNSKMNLFHNWMIPLYAKYGGAKVLENFLRILKENLPQQKELGFEQRMSVEEFVHFWSGAVGVDLEAFAKKSFGLGRQLYRSIDKARRQYPQITYSVSGIENESGTQKPPNASPTNYHSNRNLIIEISVPVFVVVLSVVVIIYLQQRRQLNILRAKYRTLTPSELKDFFDGASRSENAEGNALIESEPFNKDFEIPRSALDLKSGIILGSGEYGVVLKGILKVSASSIEIPECVTVAVKTPKPDVDVATFKALLSELKVMGHIGRHDNVIKLLGAVTVNIKNRELFVALEFCSKGDLLSYLRKNREDFKDLLKKEEPVAGPSSSSNVTRTRTENIELKQMPSTSQNYENLNNEFSALHLLEWARQIANGMNFIGVKNVIHGDLAARNVLLTVDKVAKISDFGLSRQLVNYTNYTKKSESTPMPWRWMALESLLEMKFSTQSDVWAFGVTLFEIFSLGSIPYPGGNWTHEFVDQLSSGYRLSAPKYGNEEINDLMLSCMKKEASERPDFSAITFKLQNLKTSLFPGSSAERKNCIYIDINPQNV